jgi:hypothetical protein
VGAETFCDSMLALRSHPFLSAAQLAEVADALVWRTALTPSR